MKRYFVICFFVITTALFSITLWKDESASVYGKRINLKIDDILRLQITEQSELSYHSQIKSLKNYSVDGKDGEITGVYELFPANSATESSDSKVKDVLGYESLLTAKVVVVSDTSVTVEATKLVSINNKTSQVTIRGDINCSMIRGSSVNSNDLANQQLSVVTALENLSDVITREDLEMVTDEESGKSILKLSDPKKEALIIEYLNKILSTSF